MPINTLPADFILRKHNLEVYLTKKIEPLVPFLKLFPLVDNDTGEFTTVIDSATARKDIDDSVLSEPLTVTEGADLTNIEITPINAILGRTAALGYQFRYTKQFLKRQDSDARIRLALSKIVAGMAHKINAIILRGLVDTAGVAVPTGIPSWATVTAANFNPRADAIKMRSAFTAGGAGTEDLPFELDTCFISNVRHVRLQEFYMSALHQPSFNSKEIDVDGTMFRNIKNALMGIPNTHIIGLDSKIPPGVIHKYVDPDYSTIKSAELADPQKVMEIPDSLINVNLVEPRKFSEPYIYQVVAEMGYSSQEPNAVMAGNL